MPDILIKTAEEAIQEQQDKPAVKNVLLAKNFTPEEDKAFWDNQKNTLTQSYGANFDAGKDVNAGETRDAYINRNLEANKHLWNRDAYTKREEGAYDEGRQLAAEHSGRRVSNFFRRQIDPEWYNYQMARKTPTDPVQKALFLKYQQGIGDYADKDARENNQAFTEVQSRLMSHIPTETLRNLAAHTVAAGPNGRVQTQADLEQQAYNQLYDLYTRSLYEGGNKPTPEQLLEAQKKATDEINSLKRQNKFVAYATDAGFHLGMGGAAGAASTALGGAAAASKALSLTGAGVRALQGAKTMHNMYALGHTLNGAGDVAEGLGYDRTAKGIRIGADVANSLGENMPLYYAIPGMHLGKGLPWKGNVAKKLGLKATNFMWNYPGTMMIADYVTDKLPFQATRLAANTLGYKELGQGIKDYKDATDSIKDYNERINTEGRENVDNSTWEDRNNFVNDYLQKYKKAGDDIYAIRAADAEYWGEKARKGQLPKDFMQSGAFHNLSKEQKIGIIKSFGKARAMQMAADSKSGGLGTLKTLKSFSENPDAAINRLLENDQEFKEQYNSYLYSLSPKEVLELAGDKDASTSKVLSDYSKEEILNRIANDGNFGAELILEAQQSGAGGFGANEELLNSVMEKIDARGLDNWIADIGDDNFLALGEKFTTPEGQAKLNAMGEEGEAFKARFIEAAKKQGFTRAITNPSNLNRYASLFFKSMGWNKLGEISQDPMAFYGGLAAVLGGGGLLLSGMFGDEEEEEPSGKRRLREMEDDDYAYRNRLKRYKGIVDLGLQEI